MGYAESFRWVKAHRLARKSVWMVYPLKLMEALSSVGERFDNHHDKEYIYIPLSQNSATSPPNSICFG